MAEGMIIRSLSNAETEALNDAQSAAARWVSGERPLNSDQVQELYRAVLADHRANKTARIALGLSVGELVRIFANFEWVRVTDEYGEVTCLAPPGYRIAVFPIEAVEKRIDQGVDVSVIDLRDALVKAAEDMIASGNYETR